MVVGLGLVVVILIATLVAERPVSEVDETLQPTDEVVGDLVDEAEQDIDLPDFPLGPKTVQVYFGNDAQDPDQLTCEDVYPVDRVIEPTVAVAKETLDALLLGPTSAERSEGYFTSIGSDARIESVVISQGTATVTFNADFMNGLAGSCKVGAVRAQIEETLMQFPNVGRVEINVTGVPEAEVLQP